MSIDTGFLNPHPLLTERTVFSLSGKRSAIPVVYIFWLAGRPVYVGSTQCLRERVYDRSYIGSFDSVSYAVFKTRRSAYEAEQVVIRLLNPEGNRRTAINRQAFGCLSVPSITRPVAPPIDTAAKARRVKQTKPLAPRAVVS